MCTHCWWALCKRHVSTALLGEYQGTGGVDLIQCLCMARTYHCALKPVQHLSSGTWTANTCQWENLSASGEWVLCIAAEGKKLEGAMSTLWQSRGKAGSWGCGVGGEAGSHLNTGSGVFRSLSVFWSTVIDASNLSAGHWPGEVSSSNQDILLSVNWIRLNNCEFLKGKGRDWFGLICVSSVVVILLLSKQVLCQHSVHCLECCFLARADELWDHK